MRTYEQTHPWLTFRLDLRQVSYQLWLLLGEAQSKCEHIAGTPLLPEVAQRLYHLFLAKGVLATTAIEGNTLTEKEVLQRIQGELLLPSSRAYLGQEIDNIVEACNRIGNEILNGEPITLRPESLQDYNRLVLRNLPLAEGIIPGEIRQHQVMVGRYRGAPPEDCDHLLNNLCDWLNNGFAAPAGYRIAFGVLKAIVAHLYLAWIHPFGDGNGRTARLLEFQILLSVGVPATAAHLLSNHYNQTRTEYYRHLDLAHQSGGNPLPFIQYALQGFVDGLHEQIALIKSQQLQVHWINYIHNTFKDLGSPPATRRRRLVLDLSEQREPVLLTKIRYLTPRIAEAYANKTDKTVQRDVQALEEMGLVRRTTSGIQANRELVLAFRPPTRPGE
ncbi:MAG: Fic family protein [Chloroflexota bacterium]